MRTRPISLLSVALTFAACQDITEAPLAPDPTPPEASQLTFGTPQYDGANAASVDQYGHVYVAGRTDGSLNGPNQGLQDFFIRKYHPEGEVLWADQFGTHLHDEATGVAVDSDGNAYVVGRTDGSLAGSRGGIDAFIRKYDTSGVLQWTRQFGTVAADYATAVAAGFSGVYVTGTTHGDLDGNHQGNGDIFVRKYSPDGDVIWTNQFGTPLSENGTSIAAHVGSLAVFVVGYTAGNLGVCCVQGGVDAFIRRYKPDGEVAWTIQYGTNRDDYAYAVTADPLANGIVAGATSEDGARWPTGWDAFVRKYDLSGSLVTHLQFGTPGHDFAYAVSADGASNFYVTGNTTGAVAGNSAGSSDVFVHKYNRDDELVWTRQFGTNADDRGFAVAAPVFLVASEQPWAYVAGATAGTLVGANRGKYDAFLRRLNPLDGNAVWTDQ